jgi:hypothetical protein
VDHLPRDLFGVGVFQASIQGEPVRRAAYLVFPPSSELEQLGDAETTSSFGVPSAVTSTFAGLMSRWH